MQDLPDLNQNPSYLLWITTNAWMRLLRRTLDPLGLTHVQFIVLSAVRRLGLTQEFVTQADICRFAWTDANMVSEVVRTLVAKGFIDRYSHPSDRRAHCLRLSEAGNRLVDEAKSAMIEPRDAFFAPLGEDTPEFVRMLRKIVFTADPALETQSLCELAVRPPEVEEA